MSFFGRKEANPARQMIEAANVAQLPGHTWPSANLSCGGAGKPPESVSDNGKGEYINQLMGNCGMCDQLFIFVKSTGAWVTVDQFDQVVADPQASW